MLSATWAMLFHFQFGLNLLLVAIGIVIDFIANFTLEFDEIILRHMFRELRIWNFRLPRRTDFPIHILISKNLIAYLVEIFIPGDMVAAIEMLIKYRPLTAAGLAFFTSSIKTSKFSFNFCESNERFPIIIWILELSSFL